MKLQAALSALSCSFSCDSPANILFQIRISLIQGVLKVGKATPPEVGVGRKKRAKQMNSMYCEEYHSKKNMELEIRSLFSIDSEKLLTYFCSIC